MKSLKINKRIIKFIVKKHPTDFIYIPRIRVFNWRNRFLWDQKYIGESIRSVTTKINGFYFNEKRLTIRIVVDKSNIVREIVKKFAWRFANNENRTKNSHVSKERTEKHLLWDTGAIKIKDLYMHWKLLKISPKVERES